MERFVIIVNGWKPLTIITKRSILDVAAVLDPPLVHEVEYISDFVLNGQKRVLREIIIMSDLNKVVLCLEKIKSKNLGQNPDNLKHFLLKDFNCDCEDAIKLIDEALAANIIKSVIFNGKVAYRIVRVDSVGDDTVLVPETQELMVTMNMSAQFSLKKV